MKRLTSYFLLFLWTALASAAQLAALGMAPPVVEGAPSVARAAIPDLATVLLVAAVGRLARRDVVRLAIVVTLGRVAFTAASPFAVLAGCMIVALAADGMRRFADLERGVLRIAAAGICVLIYGAWLLFVDLVRASEAMSTGAAAFGSVDLERASMPVLTAFTSAVLAALSWPVLSRLPGLARLERRAF